MDENTETIEQMEARRKEILRDEMETRFSYHAPKDGQPAKYEAIRAKAKEMALLILELCPDGMEKSLAYTWLEESVMWANAAMKREDAISALPMTPFIHELVVGSPTWNVVYVAYCEFEATILKNLPVSECRSAALCRLGECKHWIMEALVR